MDGSTTPTPAASTGLDGPALLDVFDQLAARAVRRRGRLARDGRRHALSRFLRRPRRGAARPRRTRGCVAALEEQARTLFFQSNLVPLAVRAPRRRARWSRFGPAGLDPRLLRQLRRRGERERAAPRLPHDRADAGRRGRGRLPRPHRRGRRRDRRGRERGTASRARRSRSTFVPFDDVAALAADDRRRRRRGDRRAGAGGRRRARARRAPSSSAARAAHRRARRAADLRRGAVRHGAHRLAVRGAGATASRPTS